MVEHEVFQYIQLHRTQQTKRSILVFELRLSRVRSLLPVSTNSLREDNAVEVVLILNKHIFVAAWRLTVYNAFAATPPTRYH